MTRTYRDEGMVLRTHKLGEADRIITLLTRESGLVRAVAKGVRRTSSRFGARLEPFGVVDAQIHRGRGGLDILTQVETISPYGRELSSDYELFTTASVLAETAEKLTDQDVMARQQYVLLLGAIHALANRRHPADLVLSSYLLRALAQAGWAPSCFDCAQCGKPGPQRFFAIPSGGVVCSSCRPAGASAPNAETLQLMGQLLAGDWSDLAGVIPQYRREAAGLAKAYAQWHIERRLRSLDVLESSA